MSKVCLLSFIPAINCVLLKKGFFSHINLSVNGFLKIKIIVICNNELEHIHMLDLKKQIYVAFLMIPKPNTKKIVFKLFGTIKKNPFDNKHAIKQLTYFELI